MDFLLFFYFSLKDKLKQRQEKAAKSAEKKGKQTQKSKSSAKATKKKATPPAKPPAKRTKQTKKSPSSDEDADFCIICLKILPRVLTAANSIQCNECERPVHLKCANMQASYFTCKHCSSDLDEEEEAGDDEM